MYDGSYYPGFEAPEENDMMDDGQEAAQPTAGESQGGESSAEGHAQPAEEELPTPDQVTAWLRKIVDRDGLEALLRALMRAVPRGDIMVVMEKLCHEQFGDEPLVSNGVGMQVG